MIRALVATVVLLVVPACREVVGVVTDDPRAPVTRVNATTWLVNAAAGPAVAIGSSEPITGTTGDCHYVVTAAGPTHGMRCRAPVPVQVVTLGQVSAAISDLPYSPAGKPAVPR